MEYTYKEYDCGCEIARNGYGDCWIEYCPLHGAAQKLYEACKAVDDYLNAGYPNNLKLKRVMCELVEQAIALVEKK